MLTPLSDVLRLLVESWAVALVLGVAIFGASITVGCVVVWTGLHGLDD